MDRLSVEIDTSQLRLPSEGEGQVLTVRAEAQ